MLLLAIPHNIITENVTLLGSNLAINNTCELSWCVSMRSCIDVKRTVLGCFRLHPLLLARSDPDPLSTVQFVYFLNWTVHARFIPFLHPISFIWNWCTMTELQICLFHLNKVFIYLRIILFHSCIALFLSKP